MILAAGASVGAFASRSGPFAAKAKSTVSTLSGATGTVTKGDFQERTLVSGTLRHSDPRKFKSGFRGVLIQVPVPGAILTQGDTPHRADNETTYFMRGNLPAWRNFEAGMEDDEDIRQLETALRDLGCFGYGPDDCSSWVTTSAILKWQKDLDLPWVGILPSRRIVFISGDLRMEMVAVRMGNRIIADIELFDIASTTQAVDANIKLPDQKLIVAGTAVTTKLPNAKKIAGKIAFAGIPTERLSSSGSGTGSGSDSGKSKERVIPIIVTLTNVSAITNLQEVSVTVDLPSEKRMGVLSVPVGALLALSTNQYGVETAGAGGTTHKVPVTIGLLANGHVRIPGQDIFRGQWVVAPQT